MLRRRRIDLDAIIPKANVTPIDQITGVGMATGQRRLTYVVTLDGGAPKLAPQSWPRGLPSGRRVWRPMNERRRLDSRPRSKRILSRAGSRSRSCFSGSRPGSGIMAATWSRLGTRTWHGGGGPRWCQSTPATVGTDSGSTFSVKVSNSGGTATSNTVTLAVNLPPTITTQPTNQSVLMGATATFSVAASGTGTLTYQWFKNGGSISGATSISYTTPTTVLGDSGALFTVKVTNTYGNVTSPAANLTVTAPVPPTITTQPSGQTVTLGSAATFSVVAAGTAPLSYQWFKNGTSVSGWYLPHRFKQPPVRLRPSPRQ